LSPTSALSPISALSASSVQPPNSDTSFDPNDPINERRNSQFKLRAESFKNRERLQKTAKQRVNNFLLAQKAHHDKQVLANRGLSGFGVGTGRQNLGTQLLISERHIRDL
jgi:hypothetical protein